MDGHTRFFGGVIVEVTIVKVCLTVGEHGTPLYSRTLREVTVLETNLLGHVVNEYKATVGIRIFLGAYIAPFEVNATEFDFADVIIDLEQSRAV